MKVMRILTFRQSNQNVCNKTKLSSKWKNISLIKYNKKKTVKSKFIKHQNWPHPRINQIKKNGTGKKKTWRIQKQTETIIRTMTTQTKLWEIFYSSSWFTETYAKLPWSQTQVNRNQPFATFDQLSFIHDTDLCRVQGQVSQMKNKKRKKKPKQTTNPWLFVHFFIS